MAIREIVARLYDLYDAKWDCVEERNFRAAREMLGDPANAVEDDWNAPNFEEVRGLIADLWARGDEGREALSNMALEMSVCPFHFRDYAICFDEADPECAAVRVAFPVYWTSQTAP
jgi:hypothetical protein